MKKERLIYLDMIRALSVFMIVFFHCIVRFVQFDIGGSKKLVYGANVDMGQIGVSLFFIISGVALMYTYGDSKFSVVEYFKKRWLSIFPGYYIAFAGAFLILFYLDKTINHAPEKWTIILTFLGMDGWLLNQIPNFYILGEWFLGCIIILYILFPLLRFCVNNFPRTTAVISIIYYVLLVTFYKIDMRIDWNFLTRIVDMMIGMYFVKYVKKVNLSIVLLSIAVSILLWVLPIDCVDNMYLITLCGMTTFAFLVWLCELIKNKLINDCAKVISKYSYSIFLVHHVIILRMIRKFTDSELTVPEQCCLFICICTVIGVFAYVHNKVTDKVVKYLGRIKV